MFCTNCGEKHISGKFCANCGQKLNEQKQETPTKPVARPKKANDSNHVIPDLVSLEEETEKKPTLWLVIIGVIVVAILIAVISGSNASRQAAEEESQRQANIESSNRAVQEAKKQKEAEEQLEAQKLPDTSACREVRDYLGSVDVSGQQSNQQAANTFNQISIEIRNRVANANEVRTYGVALADYFALAASYRQAGLAIDASFEGGLRQSLLNFESACDIYQ